MISYSSSVLVSRSPQATFEAAGDITRWHEWTDMRDIRGDDDGPVRLGATGTFRLARGPFRGPIRYEVTAIDPGRRLVYDLTHPAFHWVAEVTVEPAGSGSRLSTIGSFGLRGWWRLLEPFVRGELQRAEAAELVLLKRILEGDRAQSAMPKVTTAS